MKHLFKLFVVALCAILPLVGCEKSVDSVAPTVSITLIEVGSDSVTIYIQAKNANEYAYMLYDGDTITAEKVLAEGVQVEGSSSLVEVDGLTPNRRYYVVAAARNSHGAVMSDTLIFDTKNDSGSGGGERPDDPDARELTITKTTNGRWYDINNYYVTLLAESGERLIIDFYTTSETMGIYLPYGNYNLMDVTDPYTIARETSAIVLSPEDDDTEGYLFTEGYCSVDVANGYYSLYFEFSYVVEGVDYTVYGSYNGLMSGASLPAGDNTGTDKIIEVLEVGSTSFQFRINADEGQYWRCSVVDKRVYDQTVSNPGAWVLTYGFMLDGTRTFNWENGQMCEHVPGYMMNVSSSTDYLILAALMDFSSGEEYNFLGGVEIVQIHTLAEESGIGTVDIDIKEINANDVLFDCTFGDDVWCCYVAMMETANIQEIKDGKYALAGYDSYEECMLSLIPALSHDSMRQFLESQTDYRWNYLKYNTSYTMCIKIVDMNNGVSYFETEPFTTL